MKKTVIDIEEKRREKKRQKRIRICADHAGPKSSCECGHTGDGQHGQHGGLFGHGSCTVKGCACDKFTFKEFLPDLAAKLDAV